MRNSDWISFLIALTLSCIGLGFVASATYHVDAPFSRYFYKQLTGIGIGIVVFWILTFVDFRSFMRWGYALFYATIGLLILTILKGSVGMGAQRWINIGIFKFQPSELAKLFFPAYVTYYLKTESVIVPRLQIFFPVLSVLAVSALLIMKQPDLGTALIILGAGSLLLWLAGIGKKFFIFCIIICTSTAPLLWYCMKPYQRRRIAVFLGEGDSRKERYHIEQSEIAIGSGGLTGKGFLHGTQNKLQFLPESRTDFIFSVVCEEWGFGGALLVIFLYMLLFARFIYLVACMHNLYAQLFAIGLVIHIILSTIINIGMVIGLLPIVGIPLPFMSYGMSHVIITFASLGAYNSIAARRYLLSVMRA